MNSYTDRWRGYRHAHGNTVSLSATFSVQGRNASALASVPLTVRLLRDDQIIQEQAVRSTNGAFNSMPGASNDDPLAELNGDTPINLLDYSLLALNFNR